MGYTFLDGKVCYLSPLGLFVLEVDSVVFVGRLFVSPGESRYNYQIVSNDGALRFGYRHGIIFEIFPVSYQFGDLACARC